MKKAPRTELTQKILALADGILTSKQIAEQLGCNATHVQNVVRYHGAPALPRGARQGNLNPQFLGGRRVDNDGYVLVSVGLDHPHARKMPNKGYKVMYEHRLVMEKHLGRYLLPKETVDHIDGLHLHNAPSNLRLFASNAEHLRATISGQKPKWSQDGWDKMNTPRHQRASLEQIDIYAQRKKRGEIRLQQILRAALQLGIDSPYLLGTLHHLEKAQIDYSSQTTIERALDDLLQKWAIDHAQ